MQDIVRPEVESRAQDWVVASQEPLETSLIAGMAVVKLTAEPFRLSVTVGGKPALVVNSRCVGGCKGLGRGTGPRGGRGVGRDGRDGGGVM